MPQTFDDKIMFTRERGFHMIFFGRPEIEDIDMQDVQKHVPDSYLVPHRAPDGYDCQTIFSGDRVVLMAGIHDDGYVMIKSEYRPLQLSVKLRAVPDHVRAQIGKALKGHLPDYNFDADVFMNGAGEKQFAAQAKLLQKLPGGLKTAKADFNRENSFSILQAEWGMTNARMKQPVLASCGAGPCVIVSIFNEHAKSGFLSHIDDGCDLSLLTEIVPELRRKTSEKLVANFAGGWSDTHGMIVEMAMRLQEMPNVHVVGWQTPLQLINLALDTRTGAISTAFDKDQLNSGPMADKREQWLEQGMMESLSMGIPMPRAVRCVYHPELGGYDTVPNLVQSAAKRQMRPAAF